MGIADTYFDWCDRWMPGYERPEENPADAPCVRCEELIDPTETACHECGNYPFKSAKWSAVAMMAAGLLLSLTVIGAVIGIPLFIVGLLVRLGASTLSPTDHDFNSTV
jgi:predicted nucleic acid-binding Zn ribbon protein